MLHDDGFQPDIIVAIARGGYFAARVLSDHLDVYDLASIKVENYHGARKSPAAHVRYPLTAEVAGKRVLLVDDVSDSGDSFEVALQHLIQRGEPLQLRTAVLHHKSTSTFVPDYFAQKIIVWCWIVYPWAVIEDLSGFLLAMDPRPTTLEEFAATLLEKHEITVPRQTLDDVFTLNFEEQL
jgi:hypoxanthine phosphoribosyltransferase